MLDILKFIFQDFWHWLGAVILFGVVAEGIGGMFSIVINKSNKNCEE